MNRVEFRDINVNRDGATCVRFRIDSFVESFGSADRFYEEAGPDGARYLDGLRAKLKELPGSCVHAWLDDNIVGQIEMRRGNANAHSIHVLLYYLVPELRGSGLGDELDAYVTAFLRKAGATGATLRVSHTNARAIAYYRKHGWRDRGPDPLHAEVLVMDREVASERSPLP